MKTLIILAVGLLSASAFAGSINKRATVTNKSSSLIGIYVNGAYVSQVDGSQIYSLEEQLNNQDNYVTLGTVVLRLDEIKALGFRSKAVLIDFVKRTLNSGRDLAMYCSRNEAGFIDVCEYDVVARKLPATGRIPVIRSHE